MLRVGHVFVTQNKWYFTVIIDSNGYLVFKSDKTGEHYSFSKEQMKNARLKMCIKRTMLNLMKENE